MDKYIHKTQIFLSGSKAELVFCSLKSCCHVCRRCSGGWLTTHGDETEEEDLMWWRGDRSLILSPQSPNDIVVDLKSLPPPMPLLKTSISLTTYTEHTNTTAVFKHLWLHVDVLGIFCSCTADVLPHCEVWRLHIGREGGSVVGATDWPCSPAAGACVWVRGAGRPGLSLGPWA